MNPGKEREDVVKEMKEGQRGGGTMTKEGKRDSPEEGDGD